ncbi:MAG TPA: hypothetical protein VGB75_03020 [Jatrophihabitans sp.]|jgi:hypothetical protein|uniref:hypothetical protein n=1 Tax=Jatrophihabitans sp. TaxID=1932789 RepID=UPI002F160998
MVLALAELIAARNCALQSEKSMRAAGADDEPAGDEPAEAELLAADVALLAGGSARSVEVHAAVASSATPAVSTDRRVKRRVAGTR